MAPDLPLSGTEPSVWQLSERGRGYRLEDNNADPDMSRR